MTYYNENCVFMETPNNVLLDIFDTCQNFETQQLLFAGDIYKMIAGINAGIREMVITWGDFLVCSLEHI